MCTDGDFTRGGGLWVSNPSHAAANHRFAAYVEALTSALGHADRAVPFQSYCTGLLLPGERKSVEPMAARVRAGARAGGASVAASFCGQVGRGPTRRCWRRCASQVCPRSNRTARSSAWIIDDTGFPKKGTHSVGVARQYCGQLGKQDNCQVAVSLSVANDHASLPIAYQLYLPQEWADDARRGKGARAR